MILLYSSELPPRSQSHRTLRISGYEQMSMRQYERLTNNIKPDLERYEKVKAEVTDVQEFFPAASTEIAPLKQHYPKVVLIDKLADDVKKQWVFLSVGWPSLLLG